MESASLNERDRRGLHRATTALLLALKRVLGCAEDSAVLEEYSRHPDLHLKAEQLFFFEPLLRSLLLGDSPLLKAIEEAHNCYLSVVCLVAAALQSEARPQTGPAKPTWTREKLREGLQQRLDFFWATLVLRPLTGCSPAPQLSATLRLFPHVAESAVMAAVRARLRAALEECENSLALNAESYLLHSAERVVDALNNATDFLRLLVFLARALEDLRRELARRDELLFAFGVLLTANDARERAHEIDAAGVVLATESAVAAALLFLDEAGETLSRLFPFKPGKKTKIVAYYEEHLKDLLAASGRHLAFKAHSKAVVYRSLKQFVRGCPALTAFLARMRENELADDESFVALWGTLRRFGPRESESAMQAEVVREETARPRRQAAEEAEAFVDALLIGAEEEEPVRLKAGNIDIYDDEFDDTFEPIPARNPVENNAEDSADEERPQSSERRPPHRGGRPPAWRGPPGGRRGQRGRARH